MNTETEPVEQPKPSAAETLLANCSEEIQREYSDAKAELALLASCFGQLATAQTDKDAAKWGLAISKRAVRIGLRWMRARHAVRDANKPLVTLA
jgi:hypothetical protein